MFFRKGEPVKFHLSITEKDKTTYWKRQILFKNYLNAHPKEAREYEELKKKLILEDPEARQAYSDGKNEFVQRMLELSEKEIVD